MKTIERDGLQYEIVTTPVDTLAYVVGASEEIDKVFIPSEIDGVPVKSVSHGAFKHMNSITDIVFDEGIESIQFSAFQFCKSLRSVYLPKTLTSIGTSAFAQCYNLINVTTHEGLQYIYNQAFSECMISTFHFPNSLTYIGKEAFYNTRLHDITFGKNLVHIDDRAFRSCELLETVKFSENVKEIGDGAFADCIELKDITFSDSLKYLSSDVVDGCNVLESVHLGKDTRLDGHGITFAFECKSLRDFTVSPENKNYTVVDGVLYDKTIKRLIKIPSSLEKNKILIPSWVESVACNSFENIKNVKVIDFDSKEIKNIEYSGIHNFPKIKIRCHSDSQLQKALKDCGINAYPINSELTVFLNSNLENPDILKGGF